MRKILEGGIWGHLVGDALGVPVEFSSREDRKRDPVTSMRGYGTYNQPAGTWSDDSSMVLATMDSLQAGLNTDRAMECFSNWLLYADYTPFEEVFDVGVATRKALFCYGSGEKPEQCGGTSEYDNGNGSLMRILPVVLYVIAGKDGIREEDVEIIHRYSMLTHRHPRSQIACGIFAFLLDEIIKSKDTDLQTVIQTGMERAYGYYQEHLFCSEFLRCYKNLIDIEDFMKRSEDEVQSSGYVVHTLYAAIWCLLTTHSYKECVCKAVNLGNDTDTIAAISGSLAGVYYGTGTEAGVPQEWIDQLAKKDWLKGEIDRFSKLLEK